MKNFNNLIKFDILDGGGSGGGGIETTGGSDTGSSDSFTGFTNAEGTFNDGWQSHLNEDLREDNTLKAITDINQMSKMLVSSQKMIGQNRIALPNNDSTPEEWNDFYNKIGRPEDKSKYDINTDNVPENMKEMINSDMDWYKETSHKHGLSSKQAQDLFNDYQTHNAEKIAEMQGQQEVESQSRVTELRNEWGVNYDKNVTVANQALNVLGMKDDIVNAGLSNNVAVIKLLSQIGSQLSEDKLINDNNTATQDIQSEINTIMGDKNSGYWNKNNPRHQEIVNRVQMLYTKLG